mmetsp:Transcript_71810/g.191555  ORF Transcript_71810/g.191555 Transcript_71810/m.191555 type:complete len:239 (-) Transcript_71810:1349-2065(-)
MNARCCSPPRMMFPRSYRVSACFTARMFGSSSAAWSPSPMAVITVLVVRSTSISTTRLFRRLCWGWSSLGSGTTEITRPSAPACAAASPLAPGCMDHVAMVDGPYRSSCRRNHGDLLDMGFSWDPATSVRGGTSTPVACSGRWPSPGTEGSWTVTWSDSGESSSTRMLPQDTEPPRLCWSHSSWVCPVTWAMIEAMRVRWVTSTTLTSRSGVACLRTRWSSARARVRAWSKDSPPWSV